jgi:hypothetical protein
MSSITCVPFIIFRGIVRAGSTSSSSTRVTITLPSSLKIDSSDLINLSCGSLPCRDIQFFACPRAWCRNVCAEMFASRPIGFPTLTPPHIPLPIRPLVLRRASEHSLS